MAISSNQVTVTTSATRLDPSTGVPTGAVLVRNRGSAAVYLGGSNVTTANGFQLDAGESVPMDIRSGDALYGVVASGTQTVHVLQVGGA